MSIASHKTPSAVLSSLHSRGARFIAMIVLSLASTYGLASSSLAVTQPRTLTCGLTQAEIDGLSGDAGVDIHAFTTYSHTIYGLFKARKFKQIDCIADSARSHKEMFPGGMWKIHALYGGLAKPPLHPTHEDWVTHIAQMRDWVSRRPQSITAKIALAQSYVGYGWDARGSGFSDTVSDSGWKLLRERAGKAKLILERAASPSMKDPEWYVVMQNVALAQGWDREASQALFARAIKFEPTYYYYYRMYADSILPKWGGEEGEVAEFLQRTADEIGGDAGDSLYFRVAGYEICGCETDQNLKLSWARIQKGFEAVEKQTGPSPENWNLMAHMAVSFRDGVIANKFFVKIGDQWSDSVWHHSEDFDSAKLWAQQAEAVATRNRPAEEAAEANLRTDAGQLYNTLFADQVHSWMQPCLAQLTGRAPGNFELLIKVGKEGTVDDIRVGGMSAVMPCLISKIAEYRLSKKVAFTPPPQPDYWVMLNFNGDSPNSAALK